MSIDEKIIFHCSPTLEKIKSANLLSISYKEYIESYDELVFLFSKLEKKGLYIKEACRCESRILIYIYNKKMLEDTFTYEIKNYLHSIGYGESNRIEDYINTLFDRIKNVCQEFPHEIGLFLNIPLEDVLGFVENKGMNYKYSGYWKIYGDVKCTKSLFDEYRSCTEKNIRMLKSGLHILDIVKA